MCRLFRREQTGHVQTLLLSCCLSLEKQSEGDNCLMVSVGGTSQKAPAAPQDGNYTFENMRLTNVHAGSGDTLGITKQLDVWLVFRRACSRMYALEWNCSPCERAASDALVKMKWIWVMMCDVSDDEGDEREKSDTRDERKQLQENLTNTLSYCCVRP